MHGIGSYDGFYITTWSRKLSGCLLNLCQFLSPLNFSSSQPCEPHEGKSLKNYRQKKIIKKPFETSSKAGGHCAQCMVACPPCFQTIVLNHRKKILQLLYVVQPFIEITLLSLPLNIMGDCQQHVCASAHSNTINVFLSSVSLATREDDVQL